MMRRHCCASRTSSGSPRIVVGSAPVSAGELSREVPVIGTNADFLTVRKMSMGQGRFLPPGELDRSLAVCVIGTKVRSELFAHRPAVGASVRIGDRRFRVIGVLADSGRAVGFDTQELVIIPVSSAQQLFNTESLFRILVQARDPDSMARVREQVRATIAARHQGEEDVTVITQDAVLATFDRIFTALTLTLAGIASISLAVAGILIMNVMLVAVSQRTAEVGLLKALGARGRQITAIFLAEAVLLVHRRRGCGPRRSATSPTGSSGAYIPRCRLARRCGRSSSRWSSPSRAESSSG